MKSLKILFLMVPLVFVATVQALSFISEPTLSKDGDGKWWLEFEVDQATDVAVSIVNLTDSTVIRNLAAGVLGANAPAPLTQNTLHQKLSWDGKDNYGQQVTLPDTVIRGRVRVRMSPKLTSFIGDDPTWIASSFHGLQAGPDGSFFVASVNVQGIAPGFYTDGMVEIRQFDIDGNYMRTIFPSPATLPAESVSVAGINNQGAQGWSLSTYVLNFASCSKTLLNNVNGQIASAGGPGEIILSRDASFQSMRMSGAFLPQDTVKQLLPVLPCNVYAPAYGPSVYANSHNPQMLYLSGLFKGIRGSDYRMGIADDTGFWADGQVFKMDKITGQVAPWLSVHGFPTHAADRYADIGEGSYTAVFHGVDIDDSLHVFVCDRFNKRVAVYDTNAVLQGSIPLRWPDVVKVNRKTNALYVIQRSMSAIKLYKYSGWRSATAPVCSLDLGSGTYILNNRPPSVLLSEKGGKTLLTIGASASGYAYPIFVKIFRDDGDRIVFVKDVMKPAQMDNVEYGYAMANLVDYNRIAVDRRNETVYIQDCWRGLFKITDWSNPVAVHCSTSAGKPLFCDDMAIDAKRGYLYVRQCNPGTIAHEPITRYSLDYYHRPVPFSNTGNNMLTPLVGSGDVQGHPSRGMDVSPIDGSVIASHMTRYGGIPVLGIADACPMVSLFADTGSVDTSLGDTLVMPLPSQSGGAKFDLQGNYYIGTKTRAPDHVVPPGYESDDAYRWGVGAVVKYPAGSRKHAIPGGGSWTDPLGLPLVKPTDGALKVYSPGLAPFGGGETMYKGCTCRLPRFDVDNYGRLFIPNAVTKEVAVTDNSGNVIMKFGQYGNRDSHGGLPGPGLTIDKPDFPLAYPVSAAASEDYIYVGDMNNWRLMRVRMEYALDNLPGLTGNTGGAVVSMNFPAGGFALSSTPNPFSPQSTIAVYVPKSSPIKLEVYNVGGKKISEIASGNYGQGLHRFIWKGIASDGTKAAAGIYIYRLTAGTKVLHVRAILAK